MRIWILIIFYVRDQTLLIVLITYITAVGLKRRIRCVKNILKIGSAFIGVIVGAGFASGQEILQYFTSFGILGMFGAILSTVLFAGIGMLLVWLGSYTKTTSHKDVIYRISGRYLGTVIDFILIFTLFGVGCLPGPVRT